MRVAVSEPATYHIRGAGESTKGPFVTRDFDAQGEIVAALRRIIRAVDLHSKYLAQRYGLTGPQLVALQFLERRGPQTTGQLAEGVSLGQATLSDILAGIAACEQLPAGERATAYGWWGYSSCLAGH